MKHRISVRLDMELAKLMLGIATLGPGDPQHSIGPQAERFGRGETRLRIAACIRTVGALIALTQLEGERCRR